MLNFIYKWIEFVKKWHKNLKMWFFKITFTEKHHSVKKNQTITAEYVDELEDKIVDLSIKLKNKEKVISDIQLANKKRIGQISHNLKNPVGVIYSFSEMMLDNKGNFDSEKVKKYLQIIKNSASFSIELLNDIVEITRLNDVDLKFNFTKEDCNKLLYDIVESLQDNAKSKGVFIKINKQPETFEALVDKDEFTLALTKVIENAIRFSAEKGEIVIDVEENLQNFEIKVTDTGLGISKDDLPKIFDEFYVVNTYDAEGEKCIGLGLSMVKKIIDEHNGKILVKSTENVGSEFCVIIPKN